MSKQFIQGMIFGSLLYAAAVPLSNLLLDQPPSTKQQTVSIDNKPVLDQLAKLQTEIQQIKYQLSQLSGYVSALVDQFKIPPIVEQKTHRTPINLTETRSTLPVKINTPSGLDWLDKLPPDKHEQVNQVFADVGRDFRMEDIGQDDFEGLDQIMKDQQTALKDRMKTILSEKDYKSFEQSLPTF